MNNERWLYRGLEFANSYEQLDDPALDAFEEELGYRLPLDYRDFLKEHNGGRFMDSITFAITDDCLRRERTLGHFDDLASVQKKHQYRTSPAFTSRMEAFGYTGIVWPAWRIPIAETVTYYYEVCISLHPDNYGVVLRGDCTDPAAPMSPLAFREIAPSFTAWVASFELAHFQAYNDITDPPFRAAASGDVEQLDQLLTGRVDVNLRNEQGETLMLVAAHRPRVVQLLLDFDADPNLTDPMGNAPIDRAGYDSLCLLLENGADPNIPSSAFGPRLFTPDRRTMQVLLEHGADPNYVHPSGGCVCSTRGVDLELLTSHGFDAEIVFHRIMAIVEDPDSGWQDPVPVPGNALTGLGSLSDLRSFAPDIEERVRLAVENAEAETVRTRLQKILDYWDGKLNVPRFNPSP